MSIATWAKDWANSKYLHNRLFDEIDSTNSFAKENLPEDEFELIITSHQTAGRGRGQNTWLDTEPGSTLLSSWVFQSIKPPQPVAAPLIGLALYHAVLRVWPGLRFSLKAPNDLYCEDKKIAGLLVESVSEGVSHYLIVGLGMNFLSHPKLEHSGCLKDFAGEIQPDQFFRFLDFFKSSLDSMMFELTNTSLNERQRILLLEALNRSPLLKQPYLEVLPDGGLKTLSGTVPWTQI